MATPGAPSCIDADDVVTAQSSTANPVDDEPVPESSHTGGQQEDQVQSEVAEGKPDEMCPDTAELEIPHGSAPDGCVEVSQPPPMESATQLEISPELVPIELDGYELTPAVLPTTPVGLPPVAVASRYEGVMPQDAAAPLTSPGGREYYRVQRFLAHRKRGPEMSYQVRWQGYSSNDDSWVSESELKDFADNTVLDEYWSWYNSIPKGQIKSAREMRRAEP